MSPGDANRRPRAGSGDQTMTAGTPSILMVSDRGLVGRRLWSSMFPPRITVAEAVAMAELVERLVILEFRCALNDEADRLWDAKDFEGAELWRGIASRYGKRGLERIDRVESAFAELRVKAVSR